MSLLDDISVAREVVNTRANTLADTLRQKGYSWDNADQGTSRNNRYFKADKERLNQLDLLAKAIRDPSWGAPITAAADAQGEAQNAQADEGYRQAEDSRQVNTARSGLVGSSQDAAVKADNQARVAAIKTQVAQQVAEFKAAGLRDLEGLGRQLLDRALAGPEEDSARGVSTAAVLDSRRIDNAVTGVEEQYRNLLANTMAGFVNSTVTPGISMGFQAADRWNQQQRDNYYDARDRGQTTAPFSAWAANNGGTRSWWGFGED
jgi:hypothetical protein